MVLDYLGLVHLPREDVLLVVRHDDVPRVRGPENEGRFEVDFAANTLNGGMECRPRNDALPPDQR